MTTIDRKIVDLGFNNKQFEDGVQTSVKSLDALKKGLNLDEASRSLSNLGNVGRNFTLEHISEGVRSVASSFSVLGVIAFTTIQNITNSLYSLAQKWFNALTIEPLKSGLREYETQINAVQTILANTSMKGTTIDQVNSALDTLNEYSDKTIYNFTEMTRNIGTFTAAGVDLDKSVEAIKGIANLAAISGSNSQQAATAMYQLSQAMASGTVKLMDWNSVVNAGMGGQVFQDALKETARVHKINIDQMIKTEGSFRETLQKGWLTTEILTETLSKFTGDLTKEQLISMGYTETQITEIMKLGKMANDAATKVKTFSQLTQTLQEAMQSGWAQSWRIIVGDFEEAKVFMTEISDTLGVFIAADAKGRNALLQGWKDMGGRGDLIESLRNAFNALLALIKPIKEAFVEIFPPATADQLFQLTWALRMFTQNLKIGGDTADKLHRIFKGIASVFDIARMAVVALVEGLFDLAKAVIPADMGILNFLANIGDYITGVRDAIKDGDFFAESIDKVGVFLTKVSTTLKSVGDKIGAVFESISNWANGFLKQVDTSGMDEFVDKLTTRFRPISGIAEFVGKALTAIVDVTKKLLPFFYNLANIVGAGLVALGNAVMNAMVNMDFSGVFDAMNIGLFASLMVALKSFVEEGTNVFDGVTGILDGVRGSLEAWQSSLQAKTLLTIAAAIAILAASIVVLSLVDSTKLAVTLTAVTVMFGQLLASMSVFSKISGGMSTAVTSLALVALSTALLILAVAVDKLAKIDGKKLVNGLIAIEVMMLSLSTFASSMSKQSGNMIKAAIGIGVFGLALEIFVDVIRRMGSLDLPTLVNGLLGVGVVMAELALFMKVAKMDASGIITAVGVLILADALNTLADAVGKIGTLDQNQLKQGLVGIAALLVEMLAFAKVIGNGGSVNIIFVAASLGIVAGSMLIFAEAVKRLGALSWDEIGRGLATMAGSLVLVVGALKLLPKDAAFTSLGVAVIAGSMLIMAEALKSFGQMGWDEIIRGLSALGGAMLILAIGTRVMTTALPGAAAMLVVAGALLMLGPALKMLGSLSLKELGMALLSIAGFFVVMGVAGLVLAPLTPVLVALGSVMMMFGLACLNVGVGLLQFSMGMAALAISGAAGAAAIVVIVQMLAGLIPMLVETLVRGITRFGELIAEAAPALGAALTTTLLSFIKVIADVTPPLLVALKDLLFNLIAMLVEVVPPFVEAVLFLVTSILEALAASLPAIIQAAYDILLAFLKGIEDNIGEVVTTAMGIVTAFLNGVADGLPDLIDAGFNLIVAFLDGIADGIEDHMQDILDAGGRIATAIVDGLVDGLVGGAQSVASAMVDLGSAALNALKTFLGIKSPAKATTKVGKYTGQGFIDGLVDMAKNVGIAAKELGKTAVDGMSGAVSRISESLSTDIDMAPTIRPVVDMAEIIAGGKLVDKTFGEKTLNVSATTSKLTPIISSTSKNTPGETLDKTKQNPTVSFTQYNYSPESLSAYDIYRQTRNQLEQLKGLAT